MTTKGIYLVSPADCAHCQNHLAPQLKFSFAEIQSITKFHYFTHLLLFNLELTTRKEAGWFSTPQEPATTVWLFVNKKMESDLFMDQLN